MSSGDRLALEAVLLRLDDLREDMTTLESTLLSTHGALVPALRPSGRNLAHYVALRRHDLRELQADLARLGLSSLGRTEAHVLANVDAVRRVVTRLLGHEFREPEAGEHPVRFGEGREILDRNAEALLGPRPPSRRVRVMVTLPSEAADDPRLARDLVDSGMSVARINCAHDDAPAWERMAAHVRAASTATGRPCRVLMDLAGPKLRTGRLEPGPCVLHWHPARDARGRVTAPARVLLVAEGGIARPLGAPGALIPVPAAFLQELAADDVVEFEDLRGRKRRLEIASSSDAGVLATSDESAWIEPGMRLVRHRPGAGGPSPEARVGALPAAETRVLLRRGDTLVVTRPGTLGRPAAYDAEGGLVAPASVPCTLNEAFACVRPGDGAWFDDGRIGARVVTVAPEQFVVEVTHAREQGSWLGADKGINLPDTHLDVPGVGPKDAEDLLTAVRCADLVGLSFVDDPSAVRALWRLLAAADRAIGVVVKIETRRGFEHLPEILLAGMEGFPVGVMIARGDLAVECGFERMAEVQEQILWMSEAAHVPVIWATQVLETLAKKGIATRAEITDAAMSERAECVMLNKGPHITSAVRMLDDILRRMEGHQDKKSPRLRRLHISDLGEAHASRTGSPER